MRAVPTTRDDACSAATDPAGLVVIGVLRHAAVQEGPGEVVHSILLVLNGLGDGLGIEVVMHTVVQVRLHRQRLIQELLEEIPTGKNVNDGYSTQSMTVRSEKGQGQIRPPFNRQRHKCNEEETSCTDKVSWVWTWKLVCMPVPRHHWYFYHGGRYTEPQGLSKA